jgi:hypothetical protein
MMQTPIFSPKIGKNRQKHWQKSPKIVILKHRPQVKGRRPVLGQPRQKGPVTRAANQELPFEPPEAKRIHFSGEISVTRTQSYDFDFNAAGSLVRFES